VGIVAGVVFVVAVVFFSGFFTGRYYGDRDGYGPTTAGRWDPE
jgi:hypothetical protein